MKRAILAVEPTAMDKQWFPELNRIIQSMQKKQIVDEVLVLSILHPAAVLMPWSLYDARKYDLADEVAADLLHAVQDNFFAAGVRVLPSASSHAENVANEIRNFVSTSDAELLIVVREKRSRLSKWLLGSVSEQLEKLSLVPVLVIEPTEEEVHIPAASTLTSAKSAWDKINFGGVATSGL